TPGGAPPRASPRPRSAHRSRSRNETASRPRDRAPDQLRRTSGIVATTAPSCLARLGGGAEHRGNRVGIASPAGGFAIQLPTAARGEPIALRALPFARQPPPGPDPLAFFEPMKRGVE